MNKRLQISHFVSPPSYQIDDEEVYFSTMYCTLCQNKHNEPSSQTKPLSTACIRKKIIEAANKNNCRDVTKCVWTLFNFLTNTKLLLIQCSNIDMLSGMETISDTIYKEQQRHLFGKVME